jgi:hypothetical protein
MAYAGGNIIAVNPDMITFAHSREELSFQFKLTS